MKHLIITLIVMVGSIAWAKTESVRDGATANCEKCLENGNKTADKIRGLRTAISADQSYKDIYNYNARTKNQNNCEKFASESGWGIWGKTVIGTLNANDFPNIMEGTKDLRSACPAYSALSETEKKSVWVAIINTMAMGESTCGLNNHARGPNGSLIGLLQLHVGREASYSSGCRRGDGNRPETNLKCGLNMIEDQMRRNDSLFARSSYWDVLRPQARSQKYLKIKAALKSLAICK